MSGTLTRLGGIGLIGLLIVGALLAAFNAVANPASPIDPPSITFSKPYAAATVIVPVTTVPLPVVDYEALAQAAMESTAAYYGQIQPLEATLHQGKLIHEGVGPLTYVISSGFKCFTNMSLWIFGQQGDEPMAKQESESSGPCTPEQVNKMLNEFVRRGIEAGISLETMNEIRSAMQQSIWTKFGW